MTCFGGLYRTDDIYRIPTGTDTQKHIAKFAQCLDKTQKHIIEANIIRKRGQERTIGGKRNSRKCGSYKLFGESAREFGRHVLTICRTAAIAAQQQFAASAE